MPKAIYLEIYQQLKAQIESGEYAYQAFLPSENELTQTFGCSRSSIRRALSQLVADGYVQSQQGKGARVIRDPTLDVSRGYDGLETFGELAARLGFTPATRVLLFEEVTADKELARITGFPEGSSLTRTIRARLADGACVSTDESFYPSDVVEGLTPELVAKGVYTFLEGEKGLRITTSRRIVTVEAVTDDDRRRIDLNGFNALAVMRSHTFDAEGVMIEYTETRQRPEFFSQYSTAIRQKC